MVKRGPRLRMPSGQEQAKADRDARIARSLRLAKANATLTALEREVAWAQLHGMDDQKVIATQASLNELKAVLDEIERLP